MLEYQHMTYMTDHLKSRFFDVERYSHVALTEDTVTFPLWNMSGQMAGYQCYSPKLPKVHVDDPKQARYYTWVTKPCASKTAELAVWGLETITWASPLVFLTEGVFDACRLHHHNLPALAVLGCNPQHLAGWLKTLPAFKVACVQGDAAGKKLAAFGDAVVMLPAGKDVGDLTEVEFEELFRKYL